MCTQISKKNDIIKTSPLQLNVAGLLRVELVYAVAGRLLLPGNFLLRGILGRDCLRSMSANSSSQAWMKVGFLADRKRRLALRLPNSITLARLKMILSLTIGGGSCKRVFNNSCSLGDSGAYKYWFTTVDPDTPVDGLLI